MKAIVIEDENLSAEHLIHLINSIDAEIEIVARYDSVKKSIQALKIKPQIDVIFLDIHLADGLCFEIFKEVQIDIPIIFTTAYDEYAIKAFEVNSVDYLLKPIGINELEKSIVKLKRLNSNNITERIDYSNILAAFNSTDSKTYKARFLVKTGELIQSIQTEDISHFISDDGLVFLFNKKGKRFLLDFTLDSIVEMLNPKLFFRINRKVIVNINAIEKITSFFNNRLKIQIQNLDEESSTVSRERVANFKNLLDS